MNSKKYILEMNINLFVCSTLYLSSNALQYNLIYAEVYKRYILRHNIIMNNDNIEYKSLNSCIKYTTLFLSPFVLSKNIQSKCNIKMYKNITLYTKSEQRSFGICRLFVLPYRLSRIVCCLFLGIPGRRHSSKE